jgi:hypothetical protein
MRHPRPGASDHSGDKPHRNPRRSPHRGPLTAVGLWSLRDKLGEGYGAPLVPVGAYGNRDRYTLSQKCRIAPRVAMSISLSSIAMSESGSCFRCAASAESLWKKTLPEMQLDRGVDSKVCVGTRLRPQSLGSGAAEFAMMCVVD